MSSSKTSRIIPCQATHSKWILAHITSYLSNIEVKPVETGVEICGSLEDVEPALAYLRQLKLTKIKLSFSNPGLTALFTSASWIRSKSQLEDDTKSTVAVKMDEATTKRINSVSDALIQARFGEIAVTVVHGDITNDSSDVIVNSVGGNFILSQGAQSAALLRKAGDKMQQQCQNNTFMKSPFLRVTNEGNLQCDYVIHLVSPSNEQQCQNRVKLALETAEKLNAASIAIPAIGTGIMELNCATVAKSISKAIEEFASTNPRSVKAIKLVIFQSSMLSTFLQNILILKDVETQFKDRSELSYKNISVSVIQGDITSDNSDAIVNGAFTKLLSDDFDLSRGAISAALLRKAGNSMQDQCNQDPVAKSQFLRVTNKGNLSCKFVIHIVTPGTLSEHHDRMVMALEQAEKLKVSSLAIPALGTGKVGLSVENVASCMSGAFEKFAATNPAYVRQIKVVVFQQNMIKAFRANILLKKEILKRGKREKLLAQTYLKSVTKNEDVEVEITCNSQQLSKTAKEKLQLFMDQNVLRKVVKENLSNMENQDYIDIILKAVDLNVSVIFSEINSEIIVHGLKKVVVEMEAFIEKIMSEAKDARALSKTSLWKWGVPHQHFQLLPLRTSFAIEDNHKKIKDEKFSLPLFGSEIIIDLVSHNFQFLTLSGKLKRISSMAEDLPPEWTAMLGESWLKVSLDPTSYDYKRIEQKFMESKPAIQNLVKIERVQNPALYRQYELKKKHTERCMLSDSPAERELFHGTRSADEIYKHGFDRGFAGQNATLYGKGTYFHVNSSYSVRYSTVNNPSTKHMFLARVLTGNFCSGNSGLRAAPICPDTNRAFDSVVNDVKTPSIFVVFKDSSAYPSYLITFT